MAGKAAGLPVYALIGKVRERFPVYVTGGDEPIRITRVSGLGSRSGLVTDVAGVDFDHPDLNVVDGVNVDYYGSSTPLDQVASLSIPDPTTIAS